MSSRGKRRDAPRAPAGFLTNQWQPLGPGCVLDARANCATRLPGRVQALCVHPAGQRLYAATLNGGIWYSQNGGASWESLGGLDATAPAGIESASHRNACSAVAVTFGDGGAPDLVYAGTGDVTHPYDSQRASWMSGQMGRPFTGVGILRGEHQPGSGVAWVREAPNLIGSSVYRLAIEPGSTNVVAATLTGLYQRPAAAGVDVAWTRVSGSPFDTLDVECTDVLWTEAAGARPARLWVWVQRGPNAGLWARAAGAGDFTHIDTPGARGRRAVIRASTPPDHVWVFADQPDLGAPGPAPALDARAVIRPSAPRVPDDDCSKDAAPTETRQGFARVGRNGAVRLITYEVLNGKAYFEHDICLGTVEAVEAFSARVKARLEAAGRPDVKGPRAAEVLRGVAITGANYRWPGGIVPWEAVASRRALALQGIAHWQSRTIIRFVERVAANAATYPNYLSFVEDPDRCHSSAGMQGGRQEVALAAGCGFGQIVHELGHALGLRHEHNRADRDTYVHYHPENVLPDKVHNFEQHTDVNEDIGPYDYGSIMHYGRTSFGIDDAVTLEPVGGQDIGQREGLSAGDVASIRLLYSDVERPRLFRVTAADATTPVARTVFGVPDVLKQRGFECLALGVSPAADSPIYIAGSTFDFTTRDGVDHTGHAGIVRGTVSEVNGQLQFVSTLHDASRGLGVPPNIRDLAFSNTGVSVWAAGDAGVFCSDVVPGPASFYARNDGISAAEMLHLGVHPVCEGRLVATLATGVAVERISNSVWKRLSLTGNGGIAFDPLRPDRLVLQFAQGRWISSDGTLGSGGLLTRGGSFAHAEARASASHSVPATIAHRRGDPTPAAANVSQLIVGTNRLWYSENFGGTWVTLPDGSDPLPSNTSRDGIEEPIIVCAWQSPDVAWVLGERRIVRYARTPGSDAGGGPGSWSSEVILKRGGKAKKDGSTSDAPIRESVPWTDLAVNLDPPTAAGMPPASHGPKGAVYLGSVGRPGQANVDTLWWFDGTSKWFPTGLRADATAVPVTAIACDPSEPEVVYVGTTLGVWKGIRTQVGDAVPAWTWHARLNGLPEVPVQSLTFFEAGGVRLLRAGLAGRGAWELRLDRENIVPVTYLRANSDDLRYRAPPVTVKADGVTPRSWHGSPDVRPRTAPAPVPAPASLPWTQSTFSPADTAALRRFQAAFRARTNDARIRATGRWDTYFSEVLRARGAPAHPDPPADRPSITQAFWDLSMVPPFDVAEPWPTVVPTEVDLHDLSPLLAEGDLGQTSCSLPPRPTRVHVVVQRRGAAIDGIDVRATLLVWTDPAAPATAQWNDPSTWFTANVAWTQAVNEVLNSDLGTTNAGLGPGWTFAGLTPDTQSISLIGQTIDPLRPGVATFNVDLSGFAENQVVLLVAAIREGTNVVAFAPATLENLVLANANIAVRSVRIVS